jgi:hypothetical protein
MRVPILIVISSLLLLAGCDNDFMANEMDVASGDRTRPLAVLCDPPEVVPGQDVTVTLHCYDPDPGATVVRWEAVLDYNIDLYGEIETENDVVDLDETITIPSAVFDADGIGSQSFTYTVPADVLLNTRGMDDVYADPVPSEIRALIQPASPDYMTRGEIDAFLSSVDPGTLTPTELAWCRQISDYFAGEIRFRARVHNSLDLEITRNLTVRYSSRFDSDNVNENERVRRVGVITVDAPDVDSIFDLDQYDCDTTIVYHENPALIERAPIPSRSDKTYWMFTECTAQDYVSPAGIEHQETLDYNWYFLRPNNGSGEGLFFANDDDGGEPQMDDLDDDLVRIIAPTKAADADLRVFLVARDIRWEWDMFHAVPGTVLQEYTISFDVQP